MEWFKHIVESLNSFAGLFSLLAVLAAIIVPWRIYRKNKKDQRQDLQDEWDAIHETWGTMTSEERQRDIQRRTYEKKLRRK